MKRRLSTSCAIGMAAVISLGAAAELAAQQSTGTSRDSTARSTMRSTSRDSVTTGVRVRKDGSTTSSMSNITTTTSNGAVARDTSAMRDTSATTSTTIASSATSTASQGTIASSSTAVSSTSSAAIPGAGMPMRRFGNGFYIGLAAGPAIPVGQSSDVWSQGYGVSVPLGWDGPGALGLRADLGYSRLGGRTLGTGTSAFTLADQDIWSGMLDAKLRLPFGAADAPVSFYVLGGGGVHHFRTFANPSLLAGGTTGTTTSPASSRSSVTELGLNGGAGLAFNVAGANLFLESRYVTVFTERERTNMLPIVLGVTF